MFKLLKTLKDLRSFFTLASALLAAAVVAVETYQTFSQKGRRP